MHLSSVVIKLGVDLSQPYYTHWCENESEISINTYKTELNSLQIKSFGKFSQLIKTNAPFWSFFF